MGFQIEGAWDEDGKGPNIWDVFTQEPGNIYDGSSGQVACDSYHNYPQDVQLVRSMGLGHYRFSIAWTRILPQGEKLVTSYVNPEKVTVQHKLLVN